MALSITPIELNGMVGRTQDFSAMKAAEDGKANVDQMNFQTTMNEEVQNRSTTVTSSEDTSDANDNGGSRNRYAGDGGQNRRKKNEIPSGGRVLVKKSGGFDISI